VRGTDRLRDIDIKRALAAAVPGKLFDGRGLYLLITKDRQPGWRLKYRFGNAEKSISLGLYADVPLKRAREKRDDARQLLDRGVDPSAQRKSDKLARAITFKAVATEWLERQKGLAEETVKIHRARLENIMFPAFGSEPIGQIKPSALRAVLKSIEDRGRHETAHRVRALYGRIARYAVATERAERDISEALKDEMIAVPVNHFAAITDPKRVGELLRAIDGYQGQPSVMYALRLAPLVFLRPGELRGAEWAEFHLAGKEPEWRIPAQRMKMAREHIVPLATQAAKLVKELKGLTGDGRYLFPSLRTASRPISDGALNAALRRMGYGKTEMTGHGFRTTASTLLNERGFNPEVIELQLSHIDQNEIRDAYNRGKKMPERRAMMQAWADHLDELRRSSPA
jgi:integrase